MIPVGAALHRSTAHNNDYRTNVGYNQDNYSANNNIRSEYTFGNRSASQPQNIHSHVMNQPNRNAFGQYRSPPVTSTPITEHWGPSHNTTGHWGAYNNAI